MSRISTKWLPGVLVPVIAVGAAFAIPLSANAVVDLPDKTAAEVLLMIQDDPNLAFSGKITKVSDMGLPALNLSAGMSDSMVEQAEEFAPEGMEDFVPRATSAEGLSDILEIISGTHNARIYVGGQDQVKVQILDRMSERNFVLNGQELWFYDDDTQKVMHATLPEISDATKAEMKLDAETALADYLTTLTVDLSTPAKVADYFLSSIDSSTEVSVGQDAKVAGRTVYQLILKPRAAESLVDSVVMAIDSTTGLPLSVGVYAKGQVAAAFEVAFTSIDFSTPDASVFNFTPPATATIEEIKLPTTEELEAKKVELEAKKVELEALMNSTEAPTLEDLDLAKYGLETLEGFDESDMPILSGSDWTSVAEVSAGVLPADLLANPIFQELTEKVNGGSVISTALFNVLVTDDGRIFAGAVTVELLQATAAK